MSMYKYQGKINNLNTHTEYDSNNFINHVPFAECFFMGRAQKKSIIFAKAQLHLNILHK